MTDLHTLFEQFQTRLQAATDAELAETFNRETGNRGWAAARGAFHLALRDELLRRGFNCDAILDGGNLSLATRIRLNADTREVELVEQ